MKSEKEMEDEFGDGSSTHNNFDTKENMVWWDYKYATYTDNGGKRSSAISLVHEFDHAVDYHKNPIEQEKRASIFDSQYENLEERRVITGSEKETALILGQAIRLNHKLGWHGVEGFLSQNPLSVSPLFTYPPKVISK